jgi:hypothetical protein
MEQLPKDIVVASKKLQQFFKQRCVELGVTPEQVCVKSNVDLKKVNNWIESVDPDTCNISQREVVALFDTMYVNISLTVGVLPLNQITEDQLNELKR